MSRRERDLTPQWMVLAVTAEEGGAVAEIQGRLANLFRSADFPPSAAHSALPKLAEKGFVRLVEIGEHDSQNRYEVTDKGMDRLRKWVTAEAPIPTIRDAVHGKLEFATLEDLADIVIELRGHAVACQVTSDDAHRRMLTEQRRRVSKRRQPRGWEQELDAELSTAHVEDVKLAWEDMAERRRKLADKVERMHLKYASRAAAAPRSAASRQASAGE